VVVFYKEKKLKMTMSKQNIRYIGNLANSSGRDGFWRIPVFQFLPLKSRLSSGNVQMTSFQLVIKHPVSLAKSAAAFAVSTKYGFLVMAAGLAEFESDKKTLIRKTVGSNTEN
jgi:hypothetical protein